MSNEIIEEKKEIFKHAHIEQIHSEQLILSNLPCAEKTTSPT